MDKKNRLQVERDKDFSLFYLSGKRLLQTDRGSLTMPADRWESLCGDRYPCGSFVLPGCKR